MNISKPLSAFTRAIKSSEGNVIREAIPKFEFSISLELDTASPKYQEICKELIIQAIKTDIQNQDRTELWASEEISSKFTEKFNQFTVDSLYELVCLNSSGRFGLKSFITWTETKLLTAMATALQADGKELTVKMKNTILGIAKQGSRMPENSLNTFILWIEKYTSQDSELEEVLTYLTTKVKDKEINLDDMGL